MQMRQAAKNLQFEEAAAIRDQVVELKRMLVAEQPLVPAKWLTSSARGTGASVNGSINAPPSSGPKPANRRSGGPESSPAGTNQGSQLVAADARPLLASLVARRPKTDR